MNDLRTYVQYLYKYLTVPIYLYKDNRVLFCCPKQTELTMPPQIYLDELMHFEEEVAVCVTPQKTSFGRIFIEDTSKALILGPISALPYNKELLKSLCREYQISLKDTEDFSMFFRHIPAMNYDAFLNLLLLINLDINGHPLEQEAIANIKQLKALSAINQTYSLDTYTAKENDALHDNIEIEQELLYYIENGDIAGLKEFTPRVKHTAVGTIANDNLRQLKNTALVTLTLVSRAAIRGGLPSGIAYSLSNAYYQHIERLTSPKELSALQVQIQQDYCTRVADMITSNISDTLLTKSIRFVQNHTNRDIKVTDVAEYVGYSTSYLSRKFKKELGFGLNDFIRRCKLEESKMLLAYTNKTISQISTYLCFSSQSHFQRSFKQQYGITPFAYRRTENYEYKKQSTF